MKSLLHAKFSQEYFYQKLLQEAWHAMAKSIFARTVEKTGKNWNIQNCTETPQFG